MSKRTAERSASPTRAEWTRLPADPDTERDLEYRLADWSVVRTGTAGTGQYVFLPGDDALLRDEAFVVADEQSVCDLTARR